MLAVTRVLQSRPAASWGITPFTACAMTSGVAQTGTLAWMAGA